MPDLNHSKRPQKEQEALYKAFARLYCDVSKPDTFENAVACYKALVDPDPPEWSLKKTPYRYLKNKTVQTEMARIRLETRTIVAELEGMTPAQFVHECLQNARLFAERGGLGDSTASAQMMKLVGTAIGALVTKTEDVTKRPPQLTSMEQLQLLGEQVERLKQLKAPVELAEYTIDPVTEESDGNSRGTRTLEGQDDRGWPAPAHAEGPGAPAEPMEAVQAVRIHRPLDDDGPEGG